MKNINQCIKAAIALLIICVSMATKPLKPDFNGFWRINIEKSDFGEKTAATGAAAKMLISLTKTEVTFDRTFQNVPVSSKEILKLDGTELEVKQEGFTAIRTLRLSDDKAVLTVNSKYRVTRESEEPWDYTRVETYALAKDGKSLLLTRISTLPDGKQEIVKAHYDR